MTATNVITFDKGVALFSDTSVYSPEGVITGFESKSYVNEGKRWGALFTGLAANMRFWKDVLSGLDLSFDQALALLPRAFKEEHGHLADDPTAMGHVGVLVAGFSDEHQAWMMGKLNTLTRHGCEPFVMHTDDMGMLRPPIVPKGRRDSDESELELNVRELGIVEFAKRALSAQRRVHHMEDGAATRNCAVGGEGELIIITAEKVTRRVIAKWFDVVGEDRVIREGRVAREPAPSFIRLSRAERRRIAREERRAA